MAPDPTTRNWVASIGGVECLWAAGQAHRFPKHIHETFSIGLVESGVNGFLCRGRVEMAGTGTVCIVNPGEVHTGGEAGRWSYGNLYPSGPHMQELVEQVSGRRAGTPFFRTAVIQDPQAARLLRGVFSSRASGAPQVECDTWMLQALSYLVLHHADEPASASQPRYAAVAVKRVREFLDEHYRENVSLAQLAVAADMSPFYLLRIFRRSVGLPPHAYLMQRRLQKAKALLLAGVSPAQTAAETGFSDQAHLTRRFKAVFGITPGQVRERSNFVQYAPDG